MVVVGLHTSFDFTPDGSSQLSAESTFLGRKKKVNQQILKQSLLHFRHLFFVSFFQEELLNRKNYLSLRTILFPLLISWMTVLTSKFPNSAREVVVSWTVPDEKSCKGFKEEYKIPALALSLQTLLRKQKLQQTA